MLCSKYPKICQLYDGQLAMVNNDFWRFWVSMSYGGMYCNISRCDGRNGLKERITITLYTVVATSYRCYHISMLLIPDVMVSSTSANIQLETLSRTVLTHLGRVTHICVSKLTIIGSDNGVLVERHQAIIWTNAWILLIGLLGIKFSEIASTIYTFSFKKMHLKMSGKWLEFV